MEKLTEKQIEKLILSGVSSIELTEMLTTGDIFERPEICRLCKGKCCRKTPCSTTPDDFDCSISTMKAAIETGNYSIALMCKPGSLFTFRQISNKYVLSKKEIVENSDISFYVRPKGINRPTVDIMLYSPLVGQCVFYDEGKGCTLDPSKKPTLAKTFIPLKSTDCAQVYDLSDLVDEWHAFSSKLFKLATKYFDPFFPDNRYFKLL